MSTNTCDLKQLVARVGMSETTVRRLMRNHPDFPVLNKGCSGRAYVFDHVAVVAWLDRRNEARRAKAAARAAQLRQLRIEFALARSAKALVAAPTVAPATKPLSSPLKAA